MFNNGYSRVESNLFKVVDLLGEDAVLVADAVPVMCNQSEVSILVT